MPNRPGPAFVGSAGNDEKCAYITEELGFDAAFNYRTVASVDDALADHCGAGIDVYYDNVGGETLDAVLLKVNPHARIASCGMISQYNREEAAGIRNLFAIVGNRVKMQGFVVGDHLAMLADFQVEMSGWLKDGTVTYREEHRRTVSKTRPPPSSACCAATISANGWSRSATTRRSVD